METLENSKEKIKFEEIIGESAGVKYKRVDDRRDILLSSIFETFTFENVKANSCKDKFDGNVGFLEIDVLRSK